MNHFMDCNEYGETGKNINWKDIFENKTEKQEEIAIEVIRRIKIRDRKLKAGPDYPPGSHAPTSVVELNGEINR